MAEALGRETTNYMEQPQEISLTINSPYFSTYQSIRTISRQNYLQQLRMRLHTLLTSVEGEGSTEFNDMILRNNGRELHGVVSKLTSESDYFVEIVSDKEGSRRVRRLFGKFHQTDEILLNAIVRRFIDIMTGKYSYLVAITAFKVSESFELVSLTLRDALYFASDEIGCIALNQIITESNNIFRYEFFHEISENADWLSMDDSGNFVVQHVLNFHDLECTNRVAFRLCGYYVELSFERRGSYIVEQILESGSMIALDLVVSELMECGGFTLWRLAQDAFGNYVVQKALRVTRRQGRVDLFFGLVKKLKLLPFLHLLRGSHHGRNIVAIIDSTITLEFAKERRVDLFRELVEKLKPLIDLLRGYQGINIAAIIDLDKIEGVD
ncbi:pumilio homolog 18 [Arabidopsis lyrata subsp. lyrata]|nr:pumilio homolog 18 [Arabidopsis lyrata subsp. lyrata]|eukprot:XP_002866617.2 pumilio homolog 18 [Arabidopsis lyrata subsp. lyrata]